MSTSQFRQRYLRFSRQIEDDFAFLTKLKKISVRRSICQSHRCTNRQILGLRRIFLRILPHNYPPKISDLQKNSSCHFPAVGRHFCLYFQGFAQISRDFVKVFRDFAQIFKDFARIFTKSKFWGCAGAPPPTQWSKQFLQLSLKIREIFYIGYCM